MGNKTKSFDCIVFGEIIYDIYNNIPQLGGAALNYSWYLSQLGMRVLFISSVGSDSLGKKALEKISSNSLISSSITISNKKTGSAQITGTIKDPEFIINENVAWDKIKLPSGLNDYKAPSLYFGTLSQRTKFNRSSLKEFLGLKISQCNMVDLNLRKNYHTKAIIEYSLNHASFVKMNQIEFEYTRRLFKVSSPYELLDIYNIDTILITNGHENVNLINKQRTISVLPPKSNVIDTIGAGDAFFATFTAGLLKNLELDHILSKSCAIASYVTEQKGSILDLPENLKYFE